MRPEPFPKPPDPQLPKPVDGGRYARLNEDYWNRVRHLPKDAQLAWHERNK